MRFLTEKQFKYTPNMYQVIKKTNKTNTFQYKYDNRKLNVPSMQYIIIVFSSFC